MINNKKIELWEVSLNGNLAWKFTKEIHKSTWCADCDRAQGQSDRTSRTRVHIFGISDLEVHLLFLEPFHKESIQLQFFSLIRRKQRKPVYQQFNFGQWPLLSDEILKRGWSTPEAKREMFSNVWKTGRGSQVGCKNLGFCCWQKSRGDLLLCSLGPLLLQATKEIFFFFLFSELQVGCIMGKEEEIVEMGNPQNQVGALGCTTIWDWTSLVALGIPFLFISFFLWSWWTPINFPFRWFNQNIYQLCQIGLPNFQVGFCGNHP